MFLTTFLVFGIIDHWNGFVKWKRLVRNKHWPWFLFVSISILIFLWISIINLIRSDLLKKHWNFLIWQKYYFQFFASDNCLWWEKTTKNFAWCNTENSNKQWKTTNSFGQQKNDSFPFLHGNDISFPHHHHESFLIEKRNREQNKNKKFVHFELLSFIQLIIGCVEHKLFSFVCWKFIIKFLTLIYDNDLVSLVLFRFFLSFSLVKTHSNKQFPQQ